MSGVDTFASKPGLTSLNGFVVKTALTNTLKVFGPFAVFDLTDVAFAKVTAKSVKELDIDPVELKAVLNYHVTPGKVIVAKVKNGNVKTINNDNFAHPKSGNFVTV